MMRDTDFKELILTILTLNTRLGTDEIEYILKPYGIHYTRPTLLKKLNQMYDEGLVRRGQVGWTYIWETKDKEEFIQIPKKLFEKMEHDIITTDGLFASDNTDFTDIFKLDFQETINEINKFKEWKLRNY